MPRPKVDIPDRALEALIEGASLRQAAASVPCAAETLRTYAGSVEGEGRMRAIRARRRKTQHQRARRAERRAEAQARRQAATVAQRKRPLARDQRGRFTPSGWDERFPVRILPPADHPEYDIRPLGQSVEPEESPTTSRRAGPVPAPSSLRNSAASSPPPAERPPRPSRRGSSSGTWSSAPTRSTMPETRSPYALARATRSRTASRRSREDALRLELA